jgi:hypothetical protein
MFKSKRTEDILKIIHDTVETPFVTATFGNNWKEHQQAMIDKGQFTVENILHIAWFQGRRALLLEKALDDALSQLEQDDLQVEKTSEGVTDKFREKAALAAMKLIPFMGGSLMTMTAEEIATKAFRVAEAMENLRNERV